MTPHFSRCLLTIEADCHAQAPCQVLGLVTCHNVLPTWFSVRPVGQGSIRIVMELDGFDVEATERMAKRIANFPSVISVSRTLMNKRVPIFP